ncbi:MAG: MBL fold metallo-hydrolase [Dehalococcoidales bacterium]|nr:MBL fold metallo-hydrolase [Dehalococcoidales bacterium]
MKIRILGAHNCESLDTKCTCLLIDDILVIDAGGLTANLSILEQLKLKAILLTHQHYDHIKDIPPLAMNLFLHFSSINIYSIPAVYDALSNHLMNGELYPKFLEQPENNPTLKFHPLEPSQTQQIAGYSIMSIKANHSVPTVGYQVTSPDGKIVLYTGDTGMNLADCWKGVSPQLLITELTASNRFEDFAKEKHLTPNILKQELITFRQLKGYLPQVVLVHMSPNVQEEIAAEIPVIAKALNHPITLGYEGMEITL